MKIENQVCTLEQAKKLKELGISQQSTFDYKIFSRKRDYKESVCITYGGIGWESLKEYKLAESFAAFTVSELGTIIPSTFLNKSPFVHSDGMSWHNLLFKQQDGIEYQSNHKTEAEARAALLIQILENNLISIGFVNERLLAV